MTTRRAAEKDMLTLNAELEERVAQRTAQLESAVKELESFAYSVSHDLRAPLRAIEGFSRLLLQAHSASLDPEGRHYLTMVRQNAAQMGQLIDDLLAFSRLSRQAVKRQPVDMVEIARSALQVIGNVAEIRAEILLSELPSAEGDPALLKQVYVNLLSNALKFSADREQPVIEIGCRVAANEPVYFVKDNGVGFDPRYADKSFGVFQRLHRPEDYEGTGVGLAIVQRIVRWHGGRVWAEARVNQGATFYFTLGANHD